MNISDESMNLATAVYCTISDAVRKNLGSEREEMGTGAVLIAAALQSRDDEIAKANKALYEIAQILVNIPVKSEAIDKAFGIAATILNGEAEENEVKP